MGDPRLEKCVAAKRESKSIEFKTEFSPSDARHSVELLKDIIAIANSGGGAIAIGLDNQGRPCGTDVAEVLTHDMAKYCDLVKKYTHQDFTDLEVIETIKDGHAIAVFIVGGAASPLVFEQPGTYPVPDSKKQRTAFPQGTVYFRHGAKSEPATTDDIRKFMEQKIDLMRKEWLRGMRKVVDAPPGAEIRVHSPGTDSASSDAPLVFRLTNNPSAEDVIPISPDVAYPNRQCELIKAVSARLPEGIIFNSRDVLAIKRVHNIDENSQFFNQPRFGSPQYSDVFIDWICEKFRIDNDFFGKTRDRFKGGNQPTLSLG